MIAIVLGAVVNAVRFGDEDPALRIEAEGYWIRKERFARHGSDCVARFNAERRGREIRGGRNCFAPNFLSAAGDRRSGDRQDQNARNELSKAKRSNRGKP